MIYLILGSAMVFIPTTSTFVDMSIAPRAYLAVLGFVCLWRLRETPLLATWGTYLGVVALSGILAPNLGSYASRLSLDVLGAVFFWYGFQVAPWTDRKVDTLIVVALAIAVLASFMPAAHVAEDISGFITFALPLGIYGMFLGRGIKVICAAGVGWSVMSLSSLGRRADIFALTMAGLSLSFLRLRWALLAAGTVLLVGALGLFYVVQTRGVDMTERIKFYRYGAELVKQHPVLGVGRGNLPIALYPYATYGGDPAHGFNPQYKDIVAFLHNDYLDLWAEAGPLALIAYLILLGTILRRSPRTPWEAAVYASLITVVIRGLFHSVMLSPVESAWFWLFAGIYWRLKYHESQKGFSHFFIGSSGDLYEFDGVTSRRRDSVRQEAPDLGFHALPLGLPLSVQRRGGASDSWKLRGGRGLLPPHTRELPDVLGGKKQSGYGMGYDGKRGTSGKTLA